MPDPTAPTSEILYRAADLIEVDGWWQNGSTSKLAGQCAANAISRCAPDSRAQFVAHNALLVHLGADEFASLRVVFDWNDAPGRTASEVIETLRACAVIEESRERQPVEVSA